MIKYIILFICLITTTLVFADEIYIYGPPQHGVYHRSDIMDIRYRVRSMGMTRIWATTTTLTHVSTNKTIADFPLMRWNASTNATNSTEEPSVHQPWTIPDHLPVGNYTLTISGNTSYLCSKKGNGSAPFTHCKSMLYKYTSFIIANGTAAP